MELGPLGYQTIDLGSVNAVGTTTPRTVNGTNLAFQVTVANIGTSVTIRLEGSVDNINYFNLSSDESNITLTSAGTYGYALTGCPILYARLNLVSISGGSPTVSAKLGVA